MEITYFFHPDANKSYKLDTDAKGNSWIYYVQVKQFPDTGSFVHARGRDAVNSQATARKLIEAMGGLPSTEAKYIAMLKDYFAIDKKVREHFIKIFNL